MRVHSNSSVLRQRELFQELTLLVRPEVEKIVRQKLAEAKNKIHEKEMRDFTVDAVISAMVEIGMRLSEDDAAKLREEARNPQPSPPEAELAFAKETEETETDHACRALVRTWVSTLLLSAQNSESGRINLSSLDEDMLPTPMSSELAKMFAQSFSNVWLDENSARTVLRALRRTLPPDVALPQPIVELLSLMSQGDDEIA